ncbi:nicotinate-nucleotide-dimethylbenzimidazole phosphoribosyltransferase [Salsuginibacillus halophilus]|uniref:Nicotinate-nucleotide--dimethylbenzimidazole phosphoribosyltransferase n=1 Tax=Salsuginibacillus halophilus TaxID=517424 RepID=A0A2P8HL18_9BACI|nr:nicotinate-nucleotide--dimethylbenzimidazole phosphoribosyltransferase [Salsuginibacillus halophilus]PSL46913.1 nicotinate-nucleotide-dimethylbenzimidazole phosphoribosyltransferase [Salsuginibacillus halophilus]
MVDSIRSIPSRNTEAGEQTRRRLDELTKPPGSLGELENIAIELAEMTGEPSYQPGPPAILVFAADHGLAAAGVSAYPQVVTKQMVQNFAAGGAAINILAKQIGAQLTITDVGLTEPVDNHQVSNQRVAFGTKNPLESPAMSEAEASAAIQSGLTAVDDAVQAGAKSIIPGEMGIGNTASASLMLAALSELPVAQLVGPGTGLDHSGVKKKREVLEEVMRVRRPQAYAPFQALQEVGGFEIAAMSGAVIAAASHRVPILLDGFISTVAALTAVRLQPEVREYLIAGHRSCEPGHEAALEALRLTPLLDLRLRLGEGTGAALAYPVIASAAELCRGMATFTEAGVEK